MDKRQAAIFAQATIETTLPQLIETLHCASISPGLYNQICLYNEIIGGAMLTGGLVEAKLNLYETSVICLVKSKYLQIEGDL